MCTFNNNGAKIRSLSACCEFSGLLSVRMTICFLVFSKNITYSLDWFSVGLKKSLKKLNDQLLVALTKIQTKFEHF